MERAFICADGGVIGAGDLILEEPERKTDKRTLGSLTDEYERDVILRRLAFFRGNRTRTAEDLGISLRNLQYKLEKYQIRG